MTVTIEHGGGTAAEPTEALAFAWSSERLRPRHDSVVAALEAAARDDALRITVHAGKQPAWIDGPALLDGARRVAALLHRHGVRRGDPVPILLPTSPEALYALLGSMLAGAVPAPLATPMTFGAADRFVHNLAAVVRSSGARHAFTTPRLREAIAREPELAAQLETVLLPSDIHDAPRSGTFEAQSLGARDGALLQYTSGTTGHPKGVLVSHGALVSNAFAISHGLGLRPDDVGVSWLPLFHDMGLVGVLLTAICHPYELHLLRPELFLMRPRRWPATLSEVKGTLSVAPNFAYELCVNKAGKPEGLSLDRWRVALDGAEPVHASTVRRFQDHFAPAGMRDDVIMPVYGMAEHTLAVTFPSLDRKMRSLTIDGDLLERSGRAVRSGSPNAREIVSVGRPVAGTTVRVVDSKGDVVNEGRVGEIQVIGPSRMDGYWRDEIGTSAVLDDEWLRTGDLGFVDGGELYVTGRKKDLIIKGGRNIHPHDVERVVTDGVRPRGGVLAFGRGNQQTGTDDVVVIVESVGGDEAEQARVTKAVQGEVLAALDVKVDAVHLWPIGSLPRTTSGKLRRSECARILEAGGPR